ncbi:unnamed protein product [Dovyalis caffra]|uniref:Uncharacterized protein n=1 Tax=Dovyalis caffra TaxID=77055 RepID=A0AAV1RVA8_9ROSI|nr:unnamed protein product [Dovyalis caffra]
MKQHTINRVINIRSFQGSIFTYTPHPQEAEQGKRMENFLGSGEKEINRGLQRGSIHNYTTKHKFMDLLWTYEARRSCCIKNSDKDQERGVHAIFAVPNAVGFVLGSAQLILYAMYKNKSTSTESVEVMAEDGSDRLEEGGFEMLGRRNNDDKDDHDEGNLKNRSLSKGKSLPKPPVNREDSSQKIMKTVSLSDNELQHSNRANESDIENGKIDSHP